VTLFVGDDEATGLLAILDLERAGDLGEDRLALGLACLEELGDTRQTVGDVLTRDTTGVEGAHRELGTGLADGLGRDDADRRADVDRQARREVPTVAGLADTVPGVAGHHRARHDRLDTRVDQGERGRPRR
jgi:hypothetical protein